MKLILDEEYFKNKNPNTYKYLENKKTELAKRDKEKNILNGIHMVELNH